MIKIDFREAGGGIRSFRGIAELREFLNRQENDWSADLAKSLMGNASTFAQQLHRIPSNWATLRSQIATTSDAASAEAAGVLSERIRTHPPVAFNSETGAAIRELLAEQGLAAAAAAARVVGPEIPNFLPDQSKATFVGTLVGWARVTGLDSKSAAATRAAQRRTLREIQEREAENLKYLEEAENSLRARHAETMDELQSDRAQFQLAREKAAGDIAADRERWEVQWEGKLALYTEQLKLRAAVEEWSNRANAHEAGFLGQRRWACSIGLGGLVGALFWSWGALAAAHWLFSNALVAGTAKPVAGTLRPTWIHELLFAASASLLYLTLFLWLMRVLVRMMLSEHHLGVDARSRASMAHTYLALIEDKGVSTGEDRAIVLAALFRPVTDGLVKDDALPLISPATLLSGMAAK